MNTTTPSSPKIIESFSDIWARRSKAELSELAHIKRFMECLKGDPVFRDELANCVDSNPAKIAEQYGIKVDPALFRPLFHIPYANCRYDPSDTRWPLAQRWDQYCLEIGNALNALMATGETAVVHPRFNRWRQRQIARVGSEIGDGASEIVHPIAAYELSKGCTVGCWFCGVSAESFKGYWPCTSENEMLWRKILGAMMQRFGAATQTGFCYWATDPTDNPDYVKFIKAHKDVTGVVPQTTTAAPLKNLELTREVMQLFENSKGIWNRFSILSVGQLRRVHAMFSAEELLGVEMVLQNNGSLSAKHEVGRAKIATKKKSSIAVDGAPHQKENSTIACVSGFLVKPLEGTVELVSPTRASPKWPNGYRIYGLERFSNALEFGVAIDKLVAKYMPETLARGDRMAFRDDLRFERLEQGFRLGNEHGHFDIQGAPWVIRVGELIRLGTKTVFEVLAEMNANKIQPQEVFGLLNELRQSGFLDDDVMYGDL